MAIQEIRDGIKLEYYEFGEGDKYILSCDFKQSPGTSYLSELEKEGYHVFALTERGYGKSTHVFEDYGDDWYNIWADDFLNMSVEEGLIDPRKPLPWCKTDEELIAELSKITTPTLHIAAIGDQIIRPKDIIRSAAAVKGSKVVFFEDCHHGIPEQKLMETVQEILLFFKQKHIQW